MKALYFLTLSVFAMLVFRCGEANQPPAETDAATVLEATRAKMLTTPTHHYRFRSFWDNRFASSTYEDSMAVTFSYLPESEWGFGFHAAGNNAEMLYDGEDNLVIDHTERKVIRTPASAIDSNHFKHKMIFLGTP